MIKAQLVLLPLLAGSVLLWGSRGGASDPFQECAYATSERRVVVCTALIESDGVNRDELSRVYDNRGVAFAEQGEAERAMADFNQAIRLSSANATARFNRGNLFLQMRDLERAIADFTAYYQNGQIGLAIGDYSDAIRLNPGHSAAYYNRGNAFARVGELSRAVSDLTEAIRLNPRDAGAYYNRGAIYVLQDNRDRAIDDMRHVLKRDQPHAAARLALRKLGVEP